MLSDYIGDMKAAQARRLEKQGEAPDRIYAILYPPDTRASQSPPIPCSMFVQALAAEDIMDDESLPTASLSEDLAHSLEVLKEGRVILSNALVDSEGRPDHMSHMALCKNVEATIKIHKYRLDAEVHAVNRRMLEEERESNRKPRKKFNG